MGSLLGTLATLLVLLLGGAFALPHFIDWDDHKAIFEQQLERVAGRKVSVGGRVNLALLPVPELSFEKVRFAHAGGDFADPFAEVDSFAMELSLPALLAGKLEAKSVSLVRPLLRLNVDEKGQGNWTDIGTLDPSLPFVPRDVALNAVVIEEGRVEIVNVRSSLPLRIEAINGEFAADSLKGPFRFSGSAMLNGSRQDIRLAAGQVQAGSSRIKATLKSAASGLQTQFDGDLSGFTGPLTYTGVVTAKAPFGRIAPGGTAHAPPQVLDITAKSVISPEKIELTDITATLGEDIRPQIFTGEAVFNLAGAGRLDASLSTRWFDATPIAGDGDLPRLLGDLRLAMGEMIAALPVATAEGRVLFKADQIGLGEETLRQAEISLEIRPRSKPGLSVKALAPGETAVSLSGALESGEGAAAGNGFSGRIDLNGTNLSRFAAWAGMRSKTGAVRLTARPFALGADIGYSARELRLSAMRGDIGGSTFEGSLRYSAGEKRAFDLSLAAESLDLEAIFAGGLALEDLPVGDTGAEPGRDAGSPLGILLAAAQTMDEARLALRFGRIAMPGRTLNDVKAALTIRDGVLDISTLQLASSDGLQLTLNGALKSYAVAPDGDIRLSLDAARPEALAMLLSLARREGRAVDAATLAPSTPLKLTGTLMARGEARLIDFKLDGLAADSPFSFAGRYERGVQTVWGGSIDAEGWISNASGGALLAQVLPSRLENARALEAGGQSLFTLAVKGPVADRMDVSVALRSPLVSASFEGKASLVSDDADLKGRLRFDSASPDATAAFAAAVLPFDVAAPKRFSLETDLERSGNTYRLNGINAGIDGAQVTGSLKVETGGVMPALSADIEAAEASLPVLLSVLLDKSALGGSRGETATVEGGIWSERPFAQAVFSGVPQTLRLKAATLRLGDGLALENASLDASLGKNAFSIQALEGTLFRGRFAARATLDKDKGRFALKSRITLDDADLGDALSPGGVALANGRFSASLRLEGEGLSPRGLVSTLSGIGRIGLSDGVLYGLDPGAPEAVLQRHMDGQAFDRDAFRRQLLDALRKGDLAFRRLRAPVRVRNGIVQVRRASLRGKEHTTRAILALDLARLHADLEVQIGVASSRKRSKLPPVSMVFAGALPGVLTSKGELDSADLERFIAVRKMERDVEILERLNKTGRLPFPVIREQGTAKPEAAGPRIDKTDPADLSPRIRRPAGLEIERRALPELKDEAPAEPARPSWTAKPLSETANPIVIEKPAGEFERKVRSAIERSGSVSKSADGGNAAPPSGDAERPIAPPVPERKPAPVQPPSMRAGPGEPFIFPPR